MCRLVLCEAQLVGCDGFSALVKQASLLKAIAVVTRWNGKPLRRLTYFTAPR